MVESLLVTSQWVKDHLYDPDVLIVDTRGQEDYAEGHIPGALNLSSEDLFDPEVVGSQMLPIAELERRLGATGIDRRRALVLYDSSGLVPSAKVFWVLEHVGHSRTGLLDGGFPRWSAQGFPTERGSARPTPATFHAQARDNVATQAEVYASIGRTDSLIIDTRTADEYHGRTGAHARNGHIPGAHNVDWQQHIVDVSDPTLISREQLAARYNQIGATLDHEITTYCRTASRSSHTYFVLRLLGFTRVRNYAGSWMEWSNDANLPIE